MKANLQTFANNNIVKEFVLMKNINNTFYNIQENASPQVYKHFVIYIIFFKD
jgi:hypothetical protein